MVQIGPIKYDKDEEVILATSFLSGIFSGLLFGLPLGHMLGFLENPPAIGDSFGWTVVFLKVGIVLMSIGWPTTIITSLLLCKRKHKSSSRRDIDKFLFASLLVPITTIYTFLVAGFIGTPIDALLVPYLGPIATWGIGALVFFPFLILFIAIIGPDSKPGKALRRFIRRLKRGGKKERE
jgi:hypothetical protein